MENSNSNQEQQSNIRSIEDDQELNYWTKEFGIAKEELLEKVKRGSTFAAAVEQYVRNLKFAV